jgi:CubicO group peptidase (beta-lactamase class C family)
VTPPSVSVSPAAATLDALIDRACGTRYSGAVLRIERGGSVVYERAAGTVRSDGGAAIYADTRFDLASITKVFVTSVALAFVARGLLTLDEALTGVIPEWNATPHAPITLRMLLAHTAGLRSGADYRTLFGVRIEDFALNAALVAVPGERVVYSDLGFLALGVVLARRAGVALEPSIQGELHALGSANVTFARRVDPAATPATERDAWRGLVQGTVHDEKAALAGGVAGHAGLFGTARDVALLAQWYLGPLHGRSSPLPVALTAQAIAEQAYDPVLRRGLGWALKTSDDNSCGARMSLQTFGHTGFTGTCVWADAQRDLVVVLLTNAVHYGRHDLRDVRAAVCDAAVAEYGA